MGENDEYSDFGFGKLVYGCGVKSNCPTEQFQY